MTDLLHTLPDFPTNSYTHLLPSLEKHLITTTDLLTLDALEIAKRAQLPVLDLRRLANHVIAALQQDLGLREDGPAENTSAAGPEVKKKESLKKTGRDIVEQWSTISTLDNDLDAALGGGIPTGYITEITGESGAGKTQLLLSLLLSAQLPPPYGLSRPTLYISTEHPLPTSRLAQLLSTHPLLSASHPNPPNDPPKPSLAHILTLQTPDLESQDHILTYQLPVALARHHIGLVVLDSVAANFRAEYASVGARDLARRSVDLVRLGRGLRECARRYDCAVVVANQVADRFAPMARTEVGPVSAASSAGQRAGIVQSASSGQTPASSGQTPASSASVGLEQPGRREGGDGGSMDKLLSLDHQQRFFTGWGADPRETTGLKTPSLGLVWSHQIACRIALVKEAAYGYGGDAGGDGGGGEGSAEWSVRRWRRYMRVVFAGWVGGAEGGRGVEFEVWGGGLRAVGEGRGEGDGERA